MGKISVGFPYFNSVFIPLMIPLIVLMGVGPLSRWKRQEASDLLRLLWVSAVLSVVAGLLFALPSSVMHHPRSGLPLPWRFGSC